MNLDRDLRDALQPLAGDPIAAAARVLAALPDGPPPRRQAPRWLPWTLLALGLAVGTGLGIVLQRPSLATQPPTAPPTKEREQQPDEPVKVEQPRREDPRPPSAMPSDGLMVMAFGPVGIDEPKSGRQDIDDGQWFTELRTLFKTARSRAGIYVPQNDVRARLDFDTEARVDVDRVTLEFGRVWLDAGGRAAAVTVECDRVRLVLADAAAVVRRAPSGIDVLTLRGRVDVHTGAADARLAAGQSLEIAHDQTIGAITDVPFTAPATSWMTRMLALQTDRKELEEHVRSVFAAYEQGRFREAARREILKLGTEYVWMLADSIERSLATDRAFALDTAQLLARIVDFQSAPLVVTLLLLDDAELRDVVFRALRDHTDTDAGTDEKFWATASRAERRDAIERWRAELLR